MHSLSTVNWVVRWAGHVARMEEKRNADKVLLGKQERNRPAEDLGVDEA